MNYFQQVYKGKNEFWRYFLAITLVMSPFILNAVVFLFYPELLEIATSENSSISTNTDLLVNNLLFGFFLLLLFLFIKYLHGRSITSLITSRKQIDWKRIIFSFWVWFLISVLMLAIGVAMAPENLEWHFRPIPFLILVLISFFTMPLQTSFEEVLFRGYLMQSVGLLLKNKWFPLIFTSVFFGLMHGLNPEVEKIGQEIMIFYIGTGLLLGIMTLMDDGLELALGFHAANNITAAIFITTDWTVFQTDAIFLDTTEPSIGMLAFIPVFIIYPILLFIFSKKYSWTNWKDKLFGKVVKPKEEKESFFEEESFIEIE
jgi:membrane protease YdiL (CAAX protease family)